MTLDPNLQPQSAEALNDLLRDMRRASADAPREPAETDSSYAEQLYARWNLTGGSNISQVPQLRRMAGVPLLGGLLAFVWDGLTTFWLLLRRRSLLAQQIRYNKLVADSFIYLQALSESGLQIDREVQAWKSDVGELDHAVVALDAETRAQAEAFTRRIADLEARLAALERTLAGAPADHS